MSDEEFERFLKCCQAELKSKQDVLIHHYGLGGTRYNQYWYDQQTGILQFTGNDNALIKFDTIPIGSWNGEAGSWLWAWANGSLLGEIRKRAEVWKALLDVTGYHVFVMDGFDADESMAHEMTAIAVHHIDAIGMYIAPQASTKVFFAIIKRIATGQ